RYGAPCGSACACTVAAAMISAAARTSLRMAVRLARAAGRARRTWDEWLTNGDGLRRQWTIARDRLAIVAADGVFSYQDLAATSASVADVLTERGDLADARVAFLVPPSFAFVAVQRGIWRAG